VAQESESEDEEQAIYNPLKLPMGWDGKPIPYWLYKLHGLGQVGHVFSCYRIPLLFLVKPMNLVLNFKVFSFFILFLNPNTQDSSEAC
jgi:hypothetical protein